MYENAHRIYEQRVVAFVDILGWSEACKTESSQLTDAAHAIQNAANDYSQNTKKKLKTIPNSIICPGYLEVQIGAFSDSFAVSMPAKLGSSIISGATKICRNLLHLGFLTRGAITVGDLFHIDNMIFGPALIEAVSLEKEAVYPRLICSPKLLDHLGCIEPDSSECIVVDHLGRRIANLFEKWALSTTGQPMNRFEEIIPRIKEIIEVELQRHTKDRAEKRAEKWRYMRDVLPIMLRCDDE